MVFSCLGELVHTSDPAQNVKIKHTVVEVVALRTAANTHVGALT